MTVHPLPECLTAESSEAVVQALSALTQEGPSLLTLDISPVTEFTTCGAQILISLQRTMQAAGGNLSLCGRNDYVHQTMQAIGLGDLFSTLATKE